MTTGWSTCRHCGETIGIHEVSDEWVDANGLQSCAPLADQHEPDDSEEHP